MGKLDLQGKCFGNLPGKPIGYVRRPALEKELYDVLINDRHPVITLIGRGGIGKTWLTLTVIHEITELDHFNVVLWFSSRDIDLLPIGPKLVVPHVLTELEIGKEFVALIDPPEAKLPKKLNPVTFLAEQLTHSSNGPILFVFDNFETVRSPATLFTWIDTYIRLPNKVLITTRYRDFKGDYPVEVQGMNRSEFYELVRKTSSQLSIDNLLTKEYSETLYRESDGHPYVVKVMLGEVAKARQLVVPRRVVASREEVLEALFERTYSRLSQVAKRVFLTLCSWRATVPQIALEAVLLRPTNDKMNIEQAIEDLRMTSFIEVVSAADGTLFITVPLVTSVFGQRKLAVSELKTAIEADLPFLQSFGAAQPTDIQHGIAPRVNRMVSTVADRVSRKKENLDDYIPMLEFVARHYPPTWLLLASLYEELGAEHDEDKYTATKAIEAIQQYLELEIDTPTEADPTLHASNLQAAWSRLATLHKKIGDYPSEIHALVEMSRTPNISFNLISDSANQLNQLFSQQLVTLDRDEKRLLVQKLVEVMEQRVDEATATDCSRLAWLCNHLQSYSKAAYYTRVGLERDPNNPYCLKLAKLPFIQKEL